MVSPCLLVIRNCFCDTPLPLCSLCVTVSGLFRKCTEEGEKSGWAGWLGTGRGVVCFFFSFFFSFLWLRFSSVMGSPSRGSRRSRQRQSQRSSDLVRNAAVLYSFFFFPPAFCQSWLCLAAAQCTYVYTKPLRTSLLRGMFEGTWRGVICLFVCLCRTGGVGGYMCERELVCAFLSSDSRIPWVKTRQT